MSDEPEELKSENVEAVWAKAQIQGAQYLNIGSCYKPPSSTDPDYLEQLNVCLTKLPRNAHLWLGGDFNIPDIDWGNECTMHQATHATKCRQLLSIIKDASRDQVVQPPTRITQHTRSLLDLFFKNNSTLISKCETIPGIGDHEAIFVDFSLRPSKVKKPPRKVYQYRKADFQSMGDKLSAQHTQFLEKTKDMSVNDTWSTFEQLLKQLMSQHIPSKMLSGNKLYKPWITKEIQGPPEKEE